MWLCAALPTTKKSNTTTVRPGRIAVPQAAHEGMCFDRYSPSCFQQSTTLVLISSGLSWFFNSPRLCFWNNRSNHHICPLTDECLRLPDIWACNWLTPFYIEIERKFYLQLQSIQAVVVSAPPSSHPDIWVVFTLSSCKSHWYIQVWVLVCMFIYQLFIWSSLGYNYVIIIYLHDTHVHILQAYFRLASPLTPFRFFLSKINFDWKARWKNERMAMYIEVIFVCSIWARRNAFLNICQ